LDAGAIDYVVKPFRVAELLARVRAHARSVAGRSWPRPCAAGRTVRREQLVAGYVTTVRGVGLRFDP
jgi:DNA-binding response OmpR family regulator